MIDEETKQRILQWQDRLHKTFDHNGVPGGKFRNDAPRGTGWAVVCPEVPRHRLLTDAFLDFFAETLKLS
jgi:hypothetical protein